MKICQIVASYGDGGLEKHVVELCNEMSKAEDVTLIAPTEMGNSLADTVHFIPMNFKRSRHNPFLLWDLLKILRKEQFDIVHGQAGKAVMLLAILRGLFPGKTVGTIHNNRVKRSGTFVDISHIIAVSQGAKAVIKDNIPVTVVYNGIKPVNMENGFTKQQLCEVFQLDVGKPLLCSIGRLVPAKGFDLLIEAFHNVDANLLIAGDGMEREALQQQLNKLGLQDRVKLLGYRADIADILHGVDGVIIASRNEGFSYVFAEALLQGKPIVSTDVPVANEVLDAELLMETASESMSLKLNELVFDPDRWTRLMMPAYHIAHEKFALSAMVSGTLDVYRKVMETQ